MDSQFTGILDLEPSPSIPEKVADPFDEEDRFYIKGAPYVEPPDEPKNGPDIILAHMTDRLERAFTRNILYDSENGRLGDLEYVVFYDDASPVHNVKTGTLQFMAVEVSDGAFQFRPSAVAEDVFLATTDVLPLGTMPVSPFRHPFRHNVLHDLESIWWLVMWSIFKYYPENVPLEVQALKNQRRTYEALFSPIITLDKERRNALANEDPRFVPR